MEEMNTVKVGDTKTFVLAPMLEKIQLQHGEISCHKFRLLISTQL